MDSRKAADQEPDVYEVPEIAKRLRISRNAAYDGVARGEIPSVRIGRRIVVPRLAFEAMLLQAKTAQVAQ